MVSQPAIATNLVYPDSDGQPMADNTKQFGWIVVIKENLEWLFSQEPEVFVAGDLLWYPVEGNPKIRTAPDVMVVFGRPKGDRGSYRQWQEENIPAQVVFEILSPGNTQDEMERKLLFYDRYGVEEYYIYNPDGNYLRGWLRGDAGLEVIPDIDRWVSPRLRIQFMLEENDLAIYYPDGRPFLTYTELNQQLEQERQRADQAEASQRQAIPRLLALGLTPEQVAAALNIPVVEVQQSQL